MWQILYSKEKWGKGQMKKWKLKNWICAIYTMCVVAVAFAAVEVNAAEQVIARNAVQGMSYTEGDYIYEIDNENTYASITNYYGTEENVVIPATIGGYPVKRVSYMAFSRIDTMKTLTISEGIEYLSGWSVYCCNNLEEIYLPKSLKDCGAAFTFSRTGGMLQNIYLAEDNEYLKMYDGVLYSSDLKAIKAYPVGDQREILTIANGVEDIDGDIFRGSSNLKEVRIPDSVECISSWAFSGCTSLEKINIPESCTFLGQYLFEMSKISSIHIPASVQTVQMACFYNMPYLEEITVDETNQNLFMNGGAFCQKFSHGFTPNMEYYTLGKHVLAYPANNTQKKCKLSKGMEGIQYAAFDGCNYLEEIELPSTIKWIEGYAFAGNSIKKIVFKGDAPVIDEDLFYNSNQRCDIYYPMNNNTWNESVFEKFSYYTNIQWISYDLENSGTYDGEDDMGTEDGIDDGEDETGTENGSDNNDGDDETNEDETEEDDRDEVGTGDGTNIDEDVVGTDDGSENPGTDDIVKTGIWAEAIIDQEYTGSAIKVKPAVYDGEDLLTLNKDYTLNYKNNKKVGTATVIVKGKGNYKGKHLFNFEIVPRDITKEGEQLYGILTKSKTLVNVKPTVTTMINGKNKKLSSKDYEVELGYEVGEAGETGDTYDIIVTGKNNYTGTITYPVTFVANKNMLMKNAVIKIDPNKFDYDKYVDEERPTVTVKAGKTTLTEEQYEIEWPENVNAGKISVNVVGDEETMFGSKSVSFKLTGTNIKKAVKVYDLAASVDYTGEAQYPTFTLKDGSTTLTPEIDYVATYAKNVKPGTAKITIVGRGRYEGKMTAKFKINKVKLTNANVDVEPSVEYTKAGAKVNVTVTVDGKELVNGVDYKLTYKNNKKVGTATVTVAGKGGYTGKVADVPFEVTPNIFSNIEVKPIAVVAGTALKNVKVIVTDNGKKLDKKEYRMTYNIISKEGVLREATGEDIVKAGDYVNVNVYAAQNTNYVAGNCITVGFSVGNKTIEKAKVKIAPKEYTGEEVTLEEKDFLYVKVGKDELTLGQDFIIRGYDNNTTTGNNASVTIEGVGDYCGTKTVNFKITGRNVKENWADAIAEFLKGIF